MWIVPATLSLALAGNLRYAEDQAPAIVNPLFGSTMSEARINELIFQSLYGDDAELATVPVLASAGELSTDRTEMTLTLRDDARWQDGQPVTPADVVFTIKAMRDSGTASTEAGRVGFIKDAVEVGPRSVKLVFVRAEARPEDKLLFKILPAHRFKSPTVKRSDPFRSAPLGSGPYQLLKYNEDNSVSLGLSPHWPGKVGVSQLTMREVSDKNYQAKLLLYESLEALVRVLPRDLPLLQNNRKVELYPYQTNSWWYLGYNLKREPFSDPNVRRAIASLIDVDGLLAPIGTGDRLSGPFVPSSPYYNHDVPLDERDPTRGAELLVAAGFTKEGGAWTRGGKPLTLKVTAHQALESAQDVAINLQSQLLAAGIKIQVEFLEDAAWKSRVWSNRDFDLLLSQWSFDRNEDVREQFYSQGTRNFGSYQNPDVDLLLDQARDAIDPQVRKSALRSAHLKIHDDMPMLFLWTLDSYAALSTKVKNVVVHPFYFFTFVTSWEMK